MSAVVYYYLETHGLNDCHVYATGKPTKAPCHEAKVKFSLDLSQAQIEEKLVGHVKLLQSGWHCLYEADDYAVKALEAMEWFEKSEGKGWMPRSAQYSFGSWAFNAEGVLELKATYDAAARLSEMIKPQSEWGVFSERLAKTITDEFLKARLKGKELDAKSFFSEKCQTFRRGLKLAPWLKPLYELGYCSNDGRLFFAAGDDVYMLDDDPGFGPRVISIGADGTTGSVREAVRRLPRESSGSMPLKYFHGQHPEVFERMKERDPDLFHKLAVKILFKD